jgi:hypothetical protein
VRGSTTFGSAVGSLAGISRVSDVSWSPALIRMKASELVVPTLTKKPSSGSS